MRHLQLGRQLCHNWRPARYVYPAPKSSQQIDDIRTKGLKKPATLPWNSFFAPIADSQFPAVSAPDEVPRDYSLQKGSQWAGLRSNIPPSDFAWWQLAKFSGVSDFLNKLRGLPQSFHCSISVEDAWPGGAGLFRAGSGRFEDCKGCSS